MEISPIIVTRMHAGTFTEVADHLAVEEPLQIQLLYGSPGNEKQKNVAVTMRTPGNDEELAAGFLFTEGILRSNTELLQLISGASGENTVLAILKSNVIPVLQSTDRNFYVTSSCGVCGKSGIDAIRLDIKYPIANESVQVSSPTLHALPDLLRRQQNVFKSTGGLHACALFSSDGNLIALREDVVRHNALDKLIGQAVLNNQLPLSNAILLLSGRASFELVQKAAVAGISVIAAIGAPSSLAVELANEAGITLVGFLSSDRFNIYSGAQRIVELTLQS